MKNAMMGGLMLLCLLVLSGCAAQRAFHEGEELMLQERFDEAVIAYSRALQADPSRYEYRARLTGARARGALEHLRKARVLRADGELEAALQEYGQTYALDPSLEASVQEMKQVEGQVQADRLVEQALEQQHLGRVRQARDLLEGALLVAPGHERARTTLHELKRGSMTLIEGYELDTTSSEPITLKFKDARVKDVFKILSRLSGINFIFDEEIESRKITIFLENSTFTQSLELILKMNELAMRVLNPKTVILYPKTKNKEKQYEDQIIQTFYLSNIDAKKAVNLLRTMLQLRKVYVHEELNALVVRDSPEAIKLSQQILEAADRGDAEVLYALELIEVSHSDDFNLGASLDQKSVTFGLGNDQGLNFISGPISSLSDRKFLYTVPTATFDFQKLLSDTEILANPMIRVKNGSKAKVHVGSREPIVTTTSNADGAVTSTNIQYVDVGVKLDLEAKVQLDNTVLTKVTLEVSNKGANITTGSGNVAFPISTTNAQSELVLKDGERTILGGLIRDDRSNSSDRLPVIGSIPLIGDLLASHTDRTQKREILLSITPHIVRKVDLPNADVSTLWSGGEDDLRAGPTLRSFAMALDAEQNKQPPAAVPALIPADDGSSAAPVRPPAAPRVNRRQPQPLPEELAPADAPPSPGPADLPLPEPDSAGADAPIPEVGLTPDQLVRPASQGRVFLAGTQVVDSGQEFTLEVRVDEVQGLFSAPLFVTFDEALLDFVRAEEADFLSGAGEPTVFTVSPSPGQGQVIVGYKQAVGSGASGSGVLFRLVFIGKAPGRAVVGLERVNFRDPAGRQLQVTAEGLAIEVR